MQSPKDAAVSFPRKRESSNYLTLLRRSVWTPAFVGATRGFASPC